MKTVMANTFYLISIRRMVAQFISISLELNTCIKEMVIGWYLIKLDFMKLDYKIRYLMNYVRNNVFLRFKKITEQQ